jgi:hypothetical protein
VLGEEELREDEADPGGTQRRQLTVGHPGDVEAGDTDHPGGGAVEGAHHVQERGLSRAGGADDGDELAGGDGEGDVPKRLDGRVGPVGPAEALDLEHGPGSALAQRPSGGRAAARAG